MKRVFLAIIVVLVAIGYANAIDYEQLNKKAIRFQSPNVMIYPDAEDNLVFVDKLNAGKTLSQLAEGGGATAWGGITGTLSAQEDLQGVLSGKAESNHNHEGVYAPASHSHAATEITSGSLDGDRLPALSTAKRGGVPATGTPSGKYLRDDDTWQTVSGGSSPAGVLKDMQISVLQANGNLAEASGVQTWAGSDKTSQDVFTVEANTTYLVEGQYIINTGATTHTTAMAWALGGGATVASVEYQVMLWAAAANGIATAQSTVHVSGVASKVLNATGTLVYTNIQFKGIFVTTNGGTITPQIAFSANPTGTCLMKRGSWVSFSKIGADTFVEAGGWS